MTKFFDIILFYKLNLYLLGFINFNLILVCIFHLLFIFLMNLFSFTFLVVCLLVLVLGVLDLSSRIFIEIKE